MNYLLLKISEGGDQGGEVFPIAAAPPMRLSLTPLRSEPQGSVRHL